MKKIISFSLSLCFLFLAVQLNASAQEQFPPQAGWSCSLVDSRPGGQQNPEPYRFNFCANSNAFGSVRIGITDMIDHAAQLDTSQGGEFYQLTATLATGQVLFRVAVTSNVMVFDMSAHMGHPVTFTLSGAGRWTSPGGRLPLMVIEPTRTSLVIGR